MSLPNFKKIENKAIGKSIRRQGEKRIEKSIKSKVLEKVKDNGHYVSPQGIRHLSKKESTEKTKDWPKANPHGSVAWPKTDEQKREHQSRFGRAWND